MATFVYVEDSIDQELLCSHVCKQPFIEPMVHNICDNMFCRGCIQNLDWKCPSCCFGTKDDYSLVKLRALLNLLAKIKVQCNDCTIQMKHGEFEQHKLTCRGMHVPCPAKALGCTIAGPKSEMEKHSQICKYELSRWIVEPLTKELEKCNSQIDDMKIKYITLEQACSNQRAICEDLSRQMQELTQIQNDYIRVSSAVKPSFNTSDTPRKTSSDFSGFSFGGEETNTLEQACNNYKAIRDDISRQMEEPTQKDNTDSPAVEPSYNTFDTPRGFSFGSERSAEISYNYPYTIARIFEQAHTDDTLRFFNRGFESSKPITEQESNLVEKETAPISSYKTSPRRTVVARRSSPQQVKTTDSVFGFGLSTPAPGFSFGSDPPPVTGFSFGSTKPDKEPPSFSMLLE